MMFPNWANASLALSKFTELQICIMNMITLTNTNENTTSIVCDIEHRFSAPSRLVLMRSASSAHPSDIQGHCRDY